LDIFILLLALVFILFICAEYLDVVLHVGAFAILFILGVTIMTGALQYKEGEQISQNISYLASPLNTTMNATSEVRIPLYVNFSGGWSRTIGTLICCVSVLGFVLVYITGRANRRAED
jgi:hypothetical protein